MLTWQECETEYNAVKTVECYQRLLEKDGQRIVVFDTLGTPGAYAVINRMAEDNVVLAQYGYGRTDGADGRVWPWVFNAASHYWSQIAVKLKFMAEIEGGVDKMKGKKIVHLHIDSAYGREPLPAMRKITSDWGVKLVEISIPPPGLEQQSQWLQIRRERPDWVYVLGSRFRYELYCNDQCRSCWFPKRSHDLRHFWCSRRRYVSCWQICSWDLCRCQCFARRQLSFGEKN